MHSFLEIQLLPGQGCDFYCFAHCQSAAAVVVWKASSGELVKSMLGHTGWINCLELDLENSRCFSGSSDFSIRIWNLNTFECEAVLLGHTMWVNSIRLCKQKNMLVSAGSDNDVRGNFSFLNNTDKL